MTALVGLRDADESAARRFFATVGPEDLVAALHATADDVLLALVGRDEVRTAAVEGIVERLHEYAVPERLAGLHGVVRFDLVRGRQVLERHGLEFVNGAMTPRPHLGADLPVDVVMTTSLVRFLRLVSGEANAGLLYLAGHLDIEGDADLALGIGGIFRVPGTGRVAVDPRLLDPVDVATALGSVPAAHLRSVMRSGFRHVVLDEIFRRLPEFVNERKARGVDLTIGFRLLGNPSGEIERYVVRVHEGVATVETGDAGGERDATITCEGHDYLRLATGHLNPVLGVLKGRLKVKGDKAKALQLSSIIDIPHAP
ncbi:SCP2 sterol-binding domain-containing protein [Nocardioides cynanchi]|uniref:SCP2 sterol-binding domain-containing protein n=1 Tax=Nocardioides cynanchi TaxID=2558918 RepID=UPI001244C7BF|nr:SCP2 sterol-binding domain-containing protein [Nocardioides cynanchi]